MLKKIYLSQANQGHNTGPLGYNEKSGMDAITELVAKEFSKDSRFKTKRNSTGDRIDTASENGREANAWGADLYVAFHSNAGGVGARGTFGFYYSKGSFGYKVADAIVDKLSPLSPGPNKALIAKPGFIEVHTPNCPACLIEIEAHDWKEGVLFLTEKKAKIARAIYEGICVAYGVKPVDVPTLVNYVPLKKAAVVVAKALDIPCDTVGVNTNKKGADFEALLRAIADYKD